MHVTFTLEDLLEHISRLTTERDEARERLRKAERELINVRVLAGDLERKYEPKPTTYMRYVELNEQGVPLDPKALEWMRVAIAGGYPLSDAGEQDGK